MIPVSYPILSNDGNVSCFDRAVGVAGNGVPLSPVGTGKVSCMMVRDTEIKLDGVRDMRRWCSLINQ